MELYREVENTRKDSGNKIIRSLVITDVIDVSVDCYSTTTMMINRNDDDDVLLSLNRKVVDKKYREKKNLQARIGFLIKKEDFPKILEILCPSKKGREE